MTSFQIVHHKIILLHSIDFKFQNIDIEQIAIIFYSSLVTSIQDDIVVQAAMLLYQRGQKEKKTEEMQQEWAWCQTGVVILLFLDFLHHFVSWSWQLLYFGKQNCWGFKREKRPWKRQSLISWLRHVPVILQDSNQIFLQTSCHFGAISWWLLFS